MSVHSFEEELLAEIGRANDILEAYLPMPGGEQATLTEAMRYSVLAGGKRLRPILMRRAYQMFGGRGRVVEPFMAAIEMVHTSSLVHDDLPALDNDDLRRGRETTHRRYGEAFGVLAGDALLNLAYETAAGAFLTDPGCTRTGEALAILAQKSGFSGMLGGQSVDVEMEGQPLSEKQLDFIYRLKTGRLFEAALMVGAVLAGASREDVRRMEEVGEAMGLAFQIRDDILDLTGTQEVIGKPIRSDVKNSKTTWAVLYGPEAAAERADELTRTALAVLDEAGARDDFLWELIRRLASRQF